MSLYSKYDRAPKVSLDFLKTIPLLRGLTEGQLAPIMPLLKSRTYAQGTTLFHQGMPGTMVYFIEEGKIRLYGVGLNGQEHTFAVFGPGETFGELSLLDDQPRSASAVAMTQTVIWMLSKNDLDELFTQYPRVARSLNVILAGRLRATVSHLEAIVFQDVLGRLAYEMITLVEQHGCEEEDGVFVIEMPLTQSSLATIVGVTRESVNKALTTLRGLKLVRVIGPEVAIIDLEGLKRLVSERER